MADLIAQGSEVRERWRRVIPQGTFTIGRVAGAWSVGWDEHVSRRHATVTWDGQKLKVEKLPNAGNPIFFNGKRVPLATLDLDEHFVIGGTTFTLVEGEVNVSLHAAPPMTEQAFSPHFLHTLQFRKPDQRIDVLSRLPDVVASASNEHDLFVRLVNLLLEGIGKASAVAVVAVQSNSEETIDVLHWDGKAETNREFSPSARLIQQAVSCGESVVHVWDTRQQSSAAFTQASSSDWAFCTPVIGPMCQGWAIYVTGSKAQAKTGPGTVHAQDFHDDLKFTELLATTLASLREVRRVNRMNQFFSPIVVDAVAGQDPDDVLAPREASVAVLFCDLRGFSKKSEEEADDLMGLLHRVSEAMGVMTHAILKHGGVVGDFHGDAAMGFWGWPVEQPDAAKRACLAALDIRRAFESASQQEDDALSDFRVGVGVATGRAVAGKIGTTDQVKVTVFGPVVNLASRLEEMTKSIRAPILIDDVTACEVNGELSEAEARLRRVAVVRPRGMTNEVAISELLPPAAEFPELEAEHIAAYESALDALFARDWTRSFELLHDVPPTDRVKDFLTIFIAQHARTPPEDWDGVIPVP